MKDGSKSRRKLSSLHLIFLDSLLSLWQGCGSCSASNSPSVKVVLQALGCGGDSTEQPQTLEMEIQIKDITTQANPGAYNLF